MTVRVQFHLARLENRGFRSSNEGAELEIRAEAGHQRQSALPERGVERKRAEIDVRHRRIHLVERVAGRKRVENQRAVVRNGPAEALLLDVVRDEPIRDAARQIVAVTPEDALRQRVESDPHTLEKGLVHVRKESLVRLALTDRDHARPIGRVEAIGSYEIHQCADFDTRIREPCAVLVLDRVETEDGRRAGVRRARDARALQDDPELISAKSARDTAQIRPIEELLTTLHGCSRRSVRRGPFRGP